MSKAEKPKEAVRFEDPPPRTTPRYDWGKIAAKLRRRPGEWARVFDEDSASLVTAIRNGSIAALKPGKGFEVRTSNNKRKPTRTCTLWMRYIPEKDEESNAAVGNA